MRGDNQHKRGRGERSTLTTMSRDRSRHAVQLFRGFHQKTGPTTQTLLYKGKSTRMRRSQTYTLKKRCLSSKVNRACRWRLAAAVRHDAATLTIIRLRFQVPLFATSSCRGVYRTGSYKGKHHCK